MDRTGYLGGSDAAPIIGISPFKSRLDVWAQKRGEAPPQVETPAMMLGLYLEPFLRAVHEAATGEKIVSVPQKTHPEFPWMRARLDGKIKGKPIVYEAKTAAFGFDWTETIPRYYVPQLQHYLAVTGWGEARVVAMIGGRLPLREYTVWRDDDYIRDLVEVESEFWFKNVIEGIEPDPDGGAAAEDFLRRRHPVETEPLRVATPEEAALVRSYKKVELALADIERDKETVKQLIMARIGDAVGIEGEGFRVTLKKTKDVSKTDWAAVSVGLEQMIETAMSEGRFTLRPAADPNKEPSFPELVSVNTTVREGTRRFLPQIEDLA